MLQKKVKNNYKDIAKGLALFYHTLAWFFIPFFVGISVGIYLDNKFNPSLVWIFIVSACSFFLYCNFWNT